MNRLDLAIATVTGRAPARALVIAAMAITTCLAQAPSRPTASVAPPSQAQLTAEAAKVAMATIETSIAKRDYAAAVQGYRAIAQRIPVNQAALTQSLAIKDKLVGIGIDRALLEMPIQSSAPPRFAAVNTALPIGNSGNVPVDTAGAKREALRLVAIGRAALDRGDVTVALNAARQAQSLGVPEKAYANGEPRVWQLMLDVKSAAKRKNIAQTSGRQAIGAVPAAATPFGVQPAMALSEGDNASVAQMLFTQPSGPAGQPGNAAQPGNVIQQVQNLAPFPAATSQASINYQKGFEALSVGDRAKAKELFLAAWQEKESLSVSERNLLQDKLTLLQPRRMPQAGQSPGELSEIDRAQLEAQNETRRLYREVTSELAKAEQAKEDNPLDTLDELERLRRRIDGTEIDDRAKRSLIVLVDRAVADQKSFIDANRAKINLDIQNDAVRSEMARTAAVEEQIDEDISSLLERYNQYMNERRFPEAELIAKQIGELKPGSTIATQTFHNARMKTRRSMDEEVSAQKELSFLDNMIDIDRSAIGPNPDFPMTMPDRETWGGLSARRLSAADSSSIFTPTEQEIKRRLLNSKVSVRYRDAPLGEVLRDLAAATGVDIVMDRRAMGTVRVTPEDRVSLELQGQVSLDSALNLLLNPLDLAHMIDNDVLNITTRRAKESNLRTKTYRVTDLVTPIPNFVGGYEEGLAGALRSAYQMTRPQADVQFVPMSATDLQRNNMGASMNPMSSPIGNNNVLGQFSSMGSQGNFGTPTSPMSGAGGGASFADFSSLIDLIQTTVEPDTWDALGGPSTMREYAQNLSLVISTTSDVHDQIADLLESLRRLQNLQITIEVRFITLSDTFAEQIGVDFDFQVDDNTRSLPDEDEGESVTIGFNGQGFTPDLDISFSNTSFDVAAPAFGGANLGQASSLGFAILSDIEAFFFIQAIQTDNRTNVMQAPKVTLFDGQIASINDVSQRPFVTSITPVVGDFAVAQQPVIVVLNEGTQLNVQGIVSDDKRFVRLTLVPFFSQIGDVNTFTFEGRRTTRNTSTEQEDTNGDGVIDENDATNTTDEQDVVEGTTVQLPTFAFTSVSTTVSVPDGGTILLGGIKRLSEGRAERGVPMLSKIPYLSRLFRNVSVGRDAQSLMLMVTPRIIIQEEEELAQTGFDPTRQ